MTEFSRSLAVVIGINEYQNGITRLKTAVPDAIAIASILQDSYQYQLIHPDFKSGIIVNQSATSNCLTRLFTKILPQKIKPTKNDRLLLYFAGHGIARNSDTGPEGYLVPQDGEINNPDSLIRMGDLHHWLSQLECRHLLVILDCCFAGTFRWASTRKLIPIPEKIHWEHYHRFIKYPAWQVITSAAHNQEALDLLNNRDVDTGRQHSPFAEGLIKALGDRQADLVADGVITTPELYLYLRDYVELNSQERQTPGFFPLTKHDRGEYIFKLPNLEPKLEPAPKLEKDNNPYRGLESFEERHSQFFFGRQEVIADLCTKITASQRQLTVVLGISGSGKSSLVKAGLIPYLRQHQAQKWYIFAPIRPGLNPYNSLARALSQLKDKLPQQNQNTAILGDRLQNNTHEFINTIQTWSKQHPQKRLLLVIDQFEELITLAQSQSDPMIVNDLAQETWWQKLKSKLGLSSQADTNQVVVEPTEAWQQFIELLANILKKCPQLSLVVTLRSDFEPRFIHSALQLDWANARFVVRGMRTDELRDVIEKPATEMALYFEPVNLVDRLVDEVAQMPSALPLLSFTLSELYINLHRAWIEEGQEDRALKVDNNFAKEGGVAGSLTRRANQEYDNLPDDANRLTMSRVMLRMVELEGGEAVKRRVLKRELNYPSKQENQRVERVLNCLVDTRLIVTGKEAESDRIYYEPAHDFLVRGWDRLQYWLQKGQLEDHLVLQRLVTPAAFDWQKRANNKRFLWNANPHLDILKQVLNSEDNWFNQIEKEFVRSSVARKKANVSFYWRIAIAVITVLSTIVILLLLSKRQDTISQSKESKKSARLNLIANQSLDAMVDSLKAGKALQHPLLRLIKPPNKLQEQVTGTLQWSVYGVKELNRMQETTVTVRSIFPQSNLLASAEENGKIRLWNLKGKKLADWQADPKRVWSISFSPKQDYLASSSENGKIRLWNIEGEELANWQGHQGQIRSVNFSNNGQFIASAGWEDGTVNLWNSQGQLLKQWQADPEMVKSVSLSPDHRLIATAGKDETIRIWNFQGKLLQEFPVHAWRVVFSPDGQLFASAGDDGFIHVWNRQYQLINSWQADNKRLWNIAFNPDSKAIASSGEDGSAKVWDLQGKLLSEFKGHTGPVRSVSFSKDGKLLSSSGDDGTTRLWTLQNRQLTEWKGDKNQVHDVVFMPKDKLLVSGGADGIVRIWNLQGEQLAAFTPHSAPVKSVAISADGKLLASGSEDGIVRIWDLQGQLLQQLQTKSSSLETIIFSPNGQILALSGRDGKIQLWNLQGELVAQLLGHQGIVHSLRFSPNDKLLASAGQDGNVIIWDWQNQKLDHKFTDHIGEVYTVAFSPNSQWLASGGQDSTIRLWNLAANSSKGIFSIYEAQVNSVTYSSDGKAIISSDDRGSISLWNLDSGERLATWKAHKSSIETISLNLEGNLLATTGETGEIKLWRIDSFESLMSQVCSLMQNYLQNNPNVDSSDRSLCNDIP